MRLIPYLRVSTADQADTGHGLDAQRSAIVRAAAARGWELLPEVCEPITGALVSPRLAELLESCKRGDADGVVVQKIDRIARSVLNFHTMLERSRREGWALIVVEPMIDLSTREGRMVAGILAEFAQFEREIIGERVKAGIAAAQAKGVRVGARPILDDDTVSLVHSLRESGLGFRMIAHELNRLGVRPARAARWSPDGVRWVLEGRKS